MISTNKKYDIILADCPWPYFGSTTKDAAAGKHYELMTLADICAIPIREMCNERAAVFCWATCPRLPDAIDAMRAWNIYYRGVAFVWVKTRKDGGVINGQGVPPTFTKPTTELLLVGTTNRTGRPFPLLSFNMPQVIFAPRGEHSEKPDIFRKQIVELCGDRPRIELFARVHPEGWDVKGAEADGTRF